jgi:hypothetical protein
MPIHLASASITQKYNLKTQQASCVTRAVKPFFYSCGSQSAKGCETRCNIGAPSQGGRARSYETCDNTETHLNKKAMSKTKKHIAASKLTSTRR